MPTCPFCNKEIDELYVEGWECAVTRYYVYLGREGKWLEWEQRDSEPYDSGVDHICCPLCERALPIGESEMEDFLKGKLPLVRRDEVEITDEGRATYNGKTYVIEDETDEILCLRPTRGVQAKLFED